ncbi:MAG: hypothetical protein IJT56_01635 [Clostridia bacterium]|nr:hypothetical protein [Clostridia bacterium]
MPYFNNGLSLFLGYADLNTFSQLRENDFGVGILPYPKLDEEQERYVTVTHDTTETGIVPITSKKYDMIGTALEMPPAKGRRRLCRRITRLRSRSSTRATTCRRRCWISSTTT